MERQRSFCRLLWEQRYCLAVILERGLRKQSRGILAWGSLERCCNCDDDFRHIRQYAMHSHWPHIVLLIVCLAFDGVEWFSLACNLHNLPCMDSLILPITIPLVYPATASRCLSRITLTRPLDFYPIHPWHSPSPMRFQSPCHLL